LERHSVGLAHSCPRSACPNCPVYSFVRWQMRSLSIKANDRVISARAGCLPPPPIKLFLRPDIVGFIPLTSVLAFFDVFSTGLSDVIKAGPVSPSAGPLCPNNGKIHFFQLSVPWLGPSFFPSPTTLSAEEAFFSLWRALFFCFFFPEPDWPLYTENCDGGIKCFPFLSCPFFALRLAAYRSWATPRLFSQAFKCKTTQYCEGCS